MKLQDIKDKLSMDSISKKGDVITVRRGFYYRMGKTAQMYVNHVLEKYPDVHIIDSGEHWAPFRGGASVANSSHFYVKFTL